MWPWHRSLLPTFYTVPMPRIPHRSMRGDIGLSGQVRIWAVTTEADDLLCTLCGVKPLALIHRLQSKEARCIKFAGGGVVQNVSITFSTIYTCECGHCVGQRDVDERFNKGITTLQGGEEWCTGPCVCTRTARMGSCSCTDAASYRRLGARAPFWGRRFGGTPKIPRCHAP